MKIKYIKWFLLGLLSLIATQGTFAQYDELFETAASANPVPSTTQTRRSTVFVPNINNNQNRREVIIDIPFLRTTSRKIGDFPSDPLRLTTSTNFEANNCFFGGNSIDGGGSFSVCVNPGPRLPNPGIGPQPIGPCGLIPCHEESPEDKETREEQERREREEQERREREREEARRQELIRQMNQQSGLTAIRNAYEGVSFKNIEEALGFHVGARTSVLIEDLSKDVITETLSSIDSKRSIINNLNTQLTNLNTSSSAFANIQNQKKEIFSNIREDYKLLDGIIEFNRIDQTNSNFRRTLAREQLDYFSRGFEEIRQEPIFIGPSQVGFREVVVFSESPEAIGNRINHSLESNNPRNVFFPTTNENKNRLREESRSMGNFPVEEEEEEEENVDYGIILSEVLVKTREGELTSILNNDNEILNQEITHSQQFADWLIESKNDVLNYLNLNNNSQAATFCLRYLYHRFAFGGDFETDINLYIGAPNTIFQNEDDQNLAISLGLSENAIRDGFRGFGNLMNCFFASPIIRNASSDFRNRFEGFIINDIFSANRLTPRNNRNDSFLIRLGKSFNFRKSNSNKIEIGFINGIGSIFFTNGFSFPQIIDFLLRGREISNRTEANEAINSINKNWFLDTDNDSFHQEGSGPAQQPNSPGPGWVEGISKGVDCDDENHDPTNNCVREDWALDRDNDNHYDSNTIRKEYHNWDQSSSFVSGFKKVSTLAGIDCDDTDSTKTTDCEECTRECSDAEREAEANPVQRSGKSLSGFTPPSNKCKCEPKEPCAITSCEKNQKLNSEKCECIDCPSKTDRLEDTNKGFFTETQTIEGKEVAVKKATFSVNKITGLSQTDINAMSDNIEKIYEKSSIPMDLKMNINETNSNNGTFIIRFISLNVKGEVEDGIGTFNFPAGQTTELNGRTVISIVKNLNLHDKKGNFLITKPIGNESITNTLAHELGHGLGLQHHWLDFPEKNTTENILNLMNSLENPKDEFKPTVDGENILPEQKKIIEDKLKKQNRDGSDC